MSRRLHSSNGCHYGDDIMGLIASQTTSLTVVYSIAYSDADQRKHQSSVSLAFVWGIHRGPVNSPHKRSVTRKMFSFDDVIMWYLPHMALSTSYSNNTTLVTLMTINYLVQRPNCSILFHEINSGIYVPFICTRNRKHQSIMLALCAGNSPPATGEFPAQRSVTRSFDVFFDLRLNKRLSKQSRGWWFETPSRSSWRHCNVGHISNFTLEVTKHKIWNVTTIWKIYSISRDHLVNAPSQWETALHCNVSHCLGANTKWWPCLWM